VFGWVGTMDIFNRYVHAVTEKLDNLLNNDSSSSEADDGAGAPQAKPQSTHSTTTSDSDSGPGGGGGEAGEQEKYLRGMLENDDYFAELREKKRELLKLSDVLRCYRTFKLYAPFALAPLQIGLNPTPYSDAQLRGLEYLIYDNERTVYDTLPFPAIYMGDASVFRELDNAPGSYLVRRHIDYIYSYIIERALLVGVPDFMLPDCLVELRRWYRKRKMSSLSTSLCFKEHLTPEEENKCPYEWIIYTKKNSEFYTFCHGVMDRNSYIGYEANKNFLNITPISFFLVNYICGPLSRIYPNPSFESGPGDETNHLVISIEGEPDHTSVEQIANYDQWISVPLSFLDIWNANPASQLNFSSFPSRSQQQQGVDSDGAL
jgi:hypothetical protein